MCSKLLDICNGGRVLMAEAAEQKSLITKADTMFYGPITALSFISKDFLLAGEGSFLKIYSTKFSSCIAIKKVFRVSRIHGFKVVQKCENSVLMLALGGKTVRLLSISTCNNITRVDFESEEKTFGTWIWDGVKMNTGDCDEAITEKEFALVTSQNCVFIWDFSKKEEKAMSVCTEQCILYSASLWGNNFTEMIVAVGTVFNEVLIWKPFHCITDEDLTETTTMLKNSTTNVWKRLRGHEGVIFSVVFTADGKRLLSVSDDRSIRHWNMENGECLQILYGHTARVWDAKFLGQFIISIGEDAMCIVWNKCSEIVKKVKSHQGKSIWSLATHDSPMMLASGGGDASIRIWSLEMLLSSQNLRAQDICIPCCGQQNMDFPRNLCTLDMRQLLILTDNGCLFSYKFDTREVLGEQWKLLIKDDEFARYSCISVHKERKLAVIGNLHGKVRIISIDDVRFKDLKVFDGKIFSIFLMEIEALENSDDTFLAACGTNGLMILWKLIISENDIDAEEVGSFLLPYCKQRWAVACKLIRLSTDESNRSLAYGFIVGDRRGSIHVFHSHHNQNASNEASQPVQSLLSVHGKTGVTNILYHNQWIYSTGRDGFYRKFHLNCDDGLLTALEKNRACKGLDWIEGLIFAHNGDILVYGFYMQSYFALWSTMQNEVIKKIDCGGGYRSWDFSMTSPPNFEQKDMLFVYLKGTKIMTCNLAISENQKILKQGLHGREMTCIFVLGQVDKDDVLVATGSEDTFINISVYDLERREFYVAHRIDSHIGSVKSIAFIEDNSLPWVKNKTTANRHITSESNERIGDKSSLGVIRYNRSYLLFSCGSRTSLKCSCIIFNDLGGNISSFVLAEIGTSDKRKREEIVDNDIRFMSLQVISLQKFNDLSNSEHFYCIVVACSDGNIRLYGFTSTTRKFCLIMASKFHKRCVQIVRHFDCNIQSRDHHFVLSGATDGCIALWDISECIDGYLQSKLNNGNYGMDEGDGNDDVSDENNDFSKDFFGTNAKDGENFCNSTQLHASNPICNHSHKPMRVFNAHQSGIHSLSIARNTHDFSWVFASGGDDNSIFTSTFLIKKQLNRLSCNVLWTDTNSFAHYSTITGVQLVNPNLLITCSIDQRLKFWTKDGIKPKCTTDETCWKITEIFYTDVADPSDIRCFTHKDNVITIICGVGLQMQISNTDNFS